MMPTNAGTPPKAAEPNKRRPLPGFESDEVEVAQAKGTPKSAQWLSTGFKSPPDPSKHLTHTQRSQPPHSHANATTTK